MRRVAAIDIGTNTVLLLVLEADGAGARALVERATITRLGEGVDRAHALAPEASARTLACLAGYAEELRRAGAERLDVVGTSALRDARGGEAFLKEAERLLGARPRVIAGEEEARLTFAGATSGLELDGALLVFDIGGGSTELVSGARAGGRARVASAVSLDVGSVRLFERHVASDPPSASELGRVRADVRAALASAPRPPAGVTVVGVAGTVTTLAAVELGLAEYDPSRVHGAVLTRGAVSALTARLGGMSLSERRGTPGLEPGRADVIVVGATLVEELLAWASAPRLVVSDRGVRWGLALGLLSEA